MKKSKSSLGPKAKNSVPKRAGSEPSISSKTPGTGRKGAPGAPITASATHLTKL